MEGDLHHCGPPRAKSRITRVFEGNADTRGEANFVSLGSAPAHRRAEDAKQMFEAKKQDRGRLRIDGDECKGCGLCIEACPPKVIGLSERLNHYGYHTAVYAGAGCTGCGICFMVCPEPGAITVYRISPLRPSPGFSEACADLLAR